MASFSNSSAPSAAPAPGSVTDADVSPATLETTTAAPETPNPTTGILWPPR